MQKQHMSLAARELEPVGHGEQQPRVVEHEVEVEPLAITAVVITTTQPPPASRGDIVTPSSWHRDTIAMPSSLGSATPLS